MTDMASAAKPGPKVDQDRRLAYELAEQHQLADTQQFPYWNASSILSPRIDEGRASKDRWPWRFTSAESCCPRGPQSEDRRANRDQGRARRSPSAPLRNSRRRSDVHDGATVIGKWISQPRSK